MNEELQQQLMEFVYGLLEDDEANALCARITSDPEVARAYSKVKLQCDLVARAARVEETNVAWIRPEGDESAEEESQVSSGPTSAANSRRWANWCLSLAASGLIFLVGSTYLLDSQPPQREATRVAAINAMPTRVILTGPSTLSTEADNPFTVQVQNDIGAPVPMTLGYRVYDAAGHVSWEASASTDADGVAHFAVDGEFVEEGSRLQVAAEESAPNWITRPLEASPDRFSTYLRMDRPLYEPGDAVLYRSVTLSRFGLDADREVSASFDIVDAENSPLEGAAKVVTTQRGVGSGAVTLPTDLPDGKYTLVVRSPNDSFPEEWRDFHVRRFEAPRLIKKLELAQDSYTAGERVELDFSVERVAGEPLSDAQLQVETTLDEIVLPTPEAKTDALGRSKIFFVLPDSIERGRANVRVSVSDGTSPAESISKEIPINLGKVNIDFYPEGGELAADLPSRIYFYGRDPLGKPVHIDGRVVDSEGVQLADVTTVHEGRGVISLTPAANETYRLLIDKPVGVTKEVLLPPASQEQSVVINTGEGVFDPIAPIRYTLAQLVPAKPLVVAAYCRGAMVGQAMIEVRDFENESESVATYVGELSLPEKAQGVVRLTVFDASELVPQPVAERLVYRRVGRKLNVQLVADAERFTPGQSVRLDLQVSDELDAPVPAVLGISIVDDAVLNLADDKSTRMPTYFHLLTELDSPEQMEDANFYLSDEPGSTAALDSLLGTQGWRRFTKVPAVRFAQSEDKQFAGGEQNLMFGDAAASRHSWSLNWSDELAVPLTTASSIDIQRVRIPRSTRSPRSLTGNAGPFAWLAMLLSVFLLVAVGIASVRRSGTSWKVRAFAGATALASLLVVMFTTQTATRHIASTASDAPAATAELALQEAAAENASDSYASAADDIQSDRSTRFGRQLEGAVETPPLDLPSASMPMEAAQDPRPATAPAIADDSTSSRPPVAGDHRFLKANAGVAQIPQNKEEDVAAPNSEPLAAAAEPSSPPLAAKAVGGQLGSMFKAPNDGTERNEALKRTREYARWFFEDRTMPSPPANSASTIFWIPLFEADENGKASVYFDLPKHASSFRAIIEAHGAQRLGAGELLINSRQASQ
ncbi:MAG: hypothetical protein H6822_30535 [Planctomycetaceae bacterium]|nr:hypothetical protein [Planctomycetales bacterium]MCB9926522.1 hypothetical protein [Planctomycetaceae bacterium]